MDKCSYIILVFFHCHLKNIVYFSSDMNYILKVMKKSWVDACNSSYPGGEHSRIMGLRSTQATVSETLFQNQANMVADIFGASYLGGGGMRIMVRRQVRQS
jgi:hypothetical protein